MRGGWVGADDQDDVGVLRPSRICVPAEVPKVWQAHYGWRMAKRGRKYRRCSLQSRRGSALHQIGFIVVQRDEVMPR